MKCTCLVCDHSKEITRDKGYDSVECVKRNCLKNKADTCCKCRERNVE